MYSQVQVSFWPLHRIVAYSHLAIGKQPICLWEGMKKRHSGLLQIIFKRIIVSPSGEMINYELNSPFAYIYKVAVPPKKRAVHV